MDKAIVGRPVEILLVEDNPGDILLTREALHDARISNHLQVAKDGEVAMQMLRGEGEYKDTSQPDLIFLDLNMPKKDGRSVLREIKQSEKLMHIPVIVMTSSQAEVDMVRTYSLHASSYIVKPLNPTSFVEVVRSLDGFWFTLTVSVDGKD